MERTKDERAGLPFFLPHHPDIPSLAYTVASPLAPPPPPLCGKFDGIVQVSKIFGGAAFLAILARLEGVIRVAVTIDKEAIVISDQDVTVRKKVVDISEKALGIFDQTTTKHVEFGDKLHMLSYCLIKYIQGFF